MCRLLAREYSSIPGIDALMLAYGTYDRVKFLIIVVEGEELRKRNLPSILRRRV
jgi:hypothetical protein